MRYLRISPQKQRNFGTNKVNLIKRSSTYLIPTSYRQNPFQALLCPIRRLQSQSTAAVEQRNVSQTEKDVVGQDFVLVLSFFRTRALSAIEERRMTFYAPRIWMVEFLAIDRYVYRHCHVQPWNAAKDKALRIKVDRILCPWPASEPLHPWQRRRGARFAETTTHYATNLLFLYLLFRAALHVSTKSCSSEKIKESIFSSNYLCIYL